MARTKRPKNRCGDCRNTWFPKGKDLSDKCPRCGSDATEIDPTQMYATLIGIAVVAVIAAIGYFSEDGSSKPAARASGTVHRAAPRSASTVRLTKPCNLWVREQGKSRVLRRTEVGETLNIIERGPHSTLVSSRGQRSWVTNKCMARSK